MNNPRLAARYAKSLVDLAIEQHQLDAVYNDMKLLRSITLSNPDFVALLRSPIVSADKKDKIIDAILAGNVSKLTTLFINLLTVKNRESNLPEIATTFIEQYNKLNNIQTVQLTTAHTISDELKNSIVAKIKNNANTTIEIETKVREELIGGFTLQINDTLVDASILRDLNDVRKQFLKNEYVAEIR